ncbi:MAG: hypothetical protein IT233_11350 [Bacteroidia bacterium]|nr:hypothetical protein [Bacteroidia bacterium]
MKKILCVLLLINSSIYAQDSIRNHLPRKQGTLKTNPFVMIMGGLPLASEYRIIYELTTGFRVSQQIGFSYLGRTILYRALADALDTNYTYDVVFRGFRIQYMYRVFIGKEAQAPEGWYFGPVASFATGRLSLGAWMTGGRYIEFRHGYACLALGRQARVGDRIVYDFYMGMGYRKNIAEEHFPNHTTRLMHFDESDLERYYYGHFKFCTGVNFGIIF